MTVTPSVLSIVVRACRCLPVLVAVGCVTSAHAQFQRLPLESGWNLISFAVVPADPSPAAVLAPLETNFESLWTYDAASGNWSRYPRAAPGTAEIASIAPGVGYWLKTSAQTTLEVAGDATALTAGPDAIGEEWNLVGFPLTGATAYERVLRVAEVRQVWTFDAAAGRFMGIVLDPNGLVLREDFIDLLPGRGYWVYANTAARLGARLRTTLPSDVDLPPLLTTTDVQGSVPWMRLSPGDVDVGGDGLYDRSIAQRALDFSDRISEHYLGIHNAGAGVLRYAIEVVDPQGTCRWLRILDRDLSTTPATTRRVSRLTGALTTERARISLIALRRDYPIGEHECDLLIRSNGSGADDAIRPIAVRMRVGDLEGDYQLRVDIDTVDGKPADLPSPRITLSMYEDGTGLKAIIDPQRTLLMTPPVRLAGRLIETGTTRYELSGSYLMSASDAGNPFNAEIRRDITIRGMRSDRSTADGVVIGSLDLTGDYFETLRGVTEQPIRLVGRFSGQRMASTATSRDRGSASDQVSVDLPDDGTLERVLTVSDRVLIDDVDVTISAVHPRPSDLVISLTGPDGDEVVLRADSEAPLTNLTYDALAEPLESLVIFEGTVAAGEWTLRISDEVAGEAGTLLEWSLAIFGTQVHDVAGRVGAALPAGTAIVLSGCGRTEIALTAADGTFRFTNLVDCRYSVSVRQPGFESRTMTVIVAGETIEDLLLDPPPRVIPPPRVAGLPGGATLAFVELTTASGAGATDLTGFRQYGADSATFDIDRPPIGPSAGPEDSDAYLGVPDSLTGTNRIGLNGTLDGPLGQDAARIRVSIGMPVTGRSVQGGLRLAIGANP